MSPLWRDRYVAVLGSHAACLAHCPWGVSDRVRLLGRTEWEHGGPAPEWSRGLEALAGLLEAVPTRRGNLVTVLASRFVRFRLLPWSEEIGSPKELEAYARLRFEEVYGAAAADWVVRMSPEAAGRPRLAAAMERGLMDGLGECARNAGCRVGSIQPYLMAAFNRLRHNIRTNDFIFAVAEPDRGSLLVRRAGIWVNVRSAAAMDSDEALAALIARECELQGLDVGAIPPVFVHAPDRTPVAAPMINGVAPRALKLAMPAGADPGDPLFTMARAAT